MDYIVRKQKLLLKRIRIVVSFYRVIKNNMSLSVVAKELCVR